MKNIFILLVCIAAAYSVNAQIEDAFGNIPEDEIKLKECVFDPEADAAILIDVGSSDFGEDNSLVRLEHRRIKILKEKGVRHADISIQFRSENNFESVYDVKAAVFNKDETGVYKSQEVQQRQIYIKKINDYYSEVTFTFPQVKVGSILEYEYRKVSQSYWALRERWFQSDLPVYRSTYRLKIQPLVMINYLIQKREDYPISIIQHKDPRSIFFEMKNIPALGEEPFIDSRDNYAQKIDFQVVSYPGYARQERFMSTWEEVSRDLYSRDDFGKQLKVNLEEPMQFIKTEVDGRPDIEKIQLIHNYVRKNMSWNKKYSLVSDQNLKAAWKKKTANSGDINLILINMLKAAGLETYPLLVSERDNGKINKKTPFINQFNNVYAYVIAGEKKYYLDATDYYSPYYLIPYSILNTTAFIADRKIGALVDIETPETRYSDVIAVHAALENEGSLKGSVQIQSRDYAWAKRSGQYHRKTEKEYIEDFLKAGSVNLSIDSFSIENDGADSLPLIQKFNFDTRAQNTGEYTFVNINMFTGLESNPFTLNQRFSSINFGYKQSVQLNYVLQVPDGFTVDALPKSIKLVNSDRTISFSRELAYM